MTLELFWGSGSPYGWRVLLALEYKGADYVSHQLQFSTRDHKKADYLKINPRGRLPALRDGDFILTESLAMLVYVDEKFPDPPLFPGGAQERARIWEMISFCSSYFEPAANWVVGAIRKGLFDSRRERVLRAIEDAHGELGILEEALARRPWLACDHLSAADLTYYPYLEFMLRMAGREAAKGLPLGLSPFGARYPRLAAWRERMRAIPGYER
ncbi:MAG: glutathione S-transferase family protein, partial [Alphaproteobacteria bacterium]